MEKYFFYNANTRDWTRITLLLHISHEAYQILRLICWRNLDTFFEKGDSSFNNRNLDANLDCYCLTQNAQITQKGDKC